MFENLVGEEPLQRFALEARGIPEPKSRAIEDQLPWTWDDKHDTGIFVGLAIASELVASTSSEEAARLRELAMVAAARVLWQRVVTLGRTAPPDSPEARIGSKAMHEGMNSGRIKLIPAEEFRSKLEEFVRQAKKRKPPGSPPRS